MSAEPNPSELLDACRALLDDILSTPDDRERLRALRRFIDHGEQMLATARDARDVSAVRLRDYGLPMTVIARDAGVGDSYLSRRALANGSPSRRPRHSTRR